MKLKKRSYRFVLAIVIIIIIAVTTIRIFNMQKPNEVGKMNSIEAINDYCSKKDNLVLTVGVIYEGKTKYICYGTDGTILPQCEYSYEIGSITKTFTTSVLCKALYDKKVNLYDSIAQYIKLDDGQYYPTIKQLATHTAGYGEVPFSIRFKSIISSITDHKNFFSNYNTQSLINDIQRKKLSDKEYSWKYSNFGMSVLGQVLCEVYKNDYKTLVENYAQRELGLTNTHVGTNNIILKGHTKGNKESNWVWGADDAFLPAASLVSNMGDMLKYAEIQMSGEKEYLSLAHQKYAKLSTAEYDMGLGWILDNKNNIIWHTGETYGFNCFIGFDKEKKIAVTVMANYAGQTDNDSTIIGFKILKELQNGSNLIFHD
ncbi:MAG: serine hydrolase domain-containing protein [Clostridiaceae bacterium]